MLPAARCAAAFSLASARALRDSHSNTHLQYIVCYQLISKMLHWKHYFIGCAAAVPP
jgi:hypothetical protein